jgi:hypothetical protein
MGVGTEIISGGLAKRVRVSKMRIVNLENSIVSHI